MKASLTGFDIKIYSGETLAKATLLIAVSFLCKWRFKNFKEGNQMISK